MKILHLSDLHIGEGDNFEKALLLADEIIKTYTSAEKPAIVITGDITDDGEIHQLRQAKQFIEKLTQNSFEVIAIPGNHDYGNIGMVENKESQVAFKEYLGNNRSYPYKVTIGNSHIIVVDSMQAEMEKIDFLGAQGCIGQRQLTNLNAIIEDIRTSNPNDKIIVGLHHHPFYYGHFMKLRDDVDFKKVVGDQSGNNRKIDCLLFGHKHTALRLSEKEIKYNIPVINASYNTTAYRKNKEGKDGLSAFLIDTDDNTVTEVFFDCKCVISKRLFQKLSKSYYLYICILCIFIYSGC